MWPFKKNSKGFYQKTQFFIKESYAHPGRWYIFDDFSKKVVLYFDSKELAMKRCEENGWRYTLRDV